jgi:DNA-binding transcriptional MerR regulator
MLSLAQVSAQTGVSAATLRLWFLALPLASVEVAETSRRSPRYRPDAVIALRALKRFMALDGATLEDARQIL